MPVQLRNAASTLGQLVAPLSETEFLSLLRERKLALLRGTNGDRYATWVGWEALQRLIERGEYPRTRGHFRVSKESVLVPQSNWARNGKIDVSKLEEYLGKGFSVIITRIDPHVPPLATLCDDLRSRLNETSFAGVIVTSGNDGALKLHYDPEDLIVV